MFARVLAALLLFAAPAAAQSLSPEDIARMLDEEAAAPNPYAALLNDPDPARSLGAMRIMMESGDPALIEMALEFGLLSADEGVRRFAVEQHLHQEPILAVTFDGTDAAGSRALSQLVVTGMDGTVEPDGMAFGRWRVGDYSEEEECWSWEGGSTCGIVSRPEGFFLNGRMVNVDFDGRLTVTDDGSLVGMVSMKRAGTTEPTPSIPVTIRLLD